MNSLKTDHYYLIDGSGYIFRAYYALPPYLEEDGLPTGAVSGFCSNVIQVIRRSKIRRFKNKPTHLLLFLNSAKKLLEMKYIAIIKLIRSEAPEDLVPQFEYIRKSVEAFNLPLIELLNYEVDDLIATYSKKIIEAGSKVTIISSDKDLMQLVSNNIRLYDPKKKQNNREKEVKEKFGVKLSQVIDVQSLAGDSSDNIPGVPGIGIKTAAELINKYKNLDNLLKNVSEITQKKKRNTYFK